MNELISTNHNDDGDIIISGRELHGFLKVTERYSTWFERMLQFGFEENIDFTSVKGFAVVNNGAKKEIASHEMTIDMAKEISMVQRTEKGKQARQYFLQIEKAWNSPEQVMARALQIAQKQIFNYKDQITLMKPKAEFFDAVADSKDAIEMKEVAKVLDMGIGRNKLFEFLRSKRILMPNNEPYQAYVDKGYFRLIEQKYQTNDGETRINIKTLVYQKGLDFIRRKMEQSDI